jgi:Eukaryotic DNA topoisomerase I, catalytic core
MNHLIPTMKILAWIIASHNNPLLKNKALYKINPLIPHLLSMFETYELRFPVTSFSNLIIGLSKNPGNPLFQMSMRDFYAKGLNNLSKSLQLEPNVYDTHVKYFKTLLNVFRAKDIQTAKRLEKSIIQGLPLLNDTLLNNAWRKPVQSQESCISEIQSLVKKLNGKEKLLTLTEIRLIRESKDKKKLSLYSSYLKAKQGATEVYKVALREVILDSSKPYLPVKQVIPILNRCGVTVTPLFEALNPLNIGSDNRLYTTTGKVIHVFPLLGAIVNYNPLYDPIKDDSWIFQYKQGDDSDAKFSYAYTTDYKSISKTEKFDTLGPYLTSVPLKRDSWLKDLDSKNQRLKLLSCITEIIYSYAARIGSVGNSTAGEATYGLSTLLKEHVTVTHDSITFDYRGKKNVRQVHVINRDSSVNSKIIDIISKHYSSIEDNSRLFEVYGKPVNGVDVNRYLKSKNCPDAHKFRSIKATNLFNSEIATRTLKKDAKLVDAEKLVKAVSLVVGEALGHKTGNGEKVTGTTALKAYIDPTSVKKWFVTHNFRVPAWVGKI